MTPRQIQLVRSTFARLYRDPVAAGRLFYDRLFAAAPETRAMFKGDPDGQARKLMDTLNVAISTLRDPPSLAPILERLGRSHAGYGVEDRHYDLVGAALLDTLERALGAAFTPEVKGAWTELYRTVSSTMKAAAGGRRAAA